MLKTYVPTIDDAIALPVEALALRILWTLQAASEATLHAGNAFLDLSHAYDAPLGEKPHSQGKQAAFEAAIATSHAWLVSHGLVAPWYSSNYIHLIVTAKGRSITDEAAFEDFVFERSLQRTALHPRLQGDAWHFYFSRKFDHAIFEAFKQVEIAVRTRAHLAPEDIGVGLMRKAFAPSSGPLTDTTLPAAEQDAIAHLFAGAIGAFKNPNSHRQVELDDPAQAAELLLLASHLLRIVDQRASAASL